MEQEKGLYQFEIEKVKIVIISAKPSSRRQSESTNADFMLIKIIARISLSLIRRFWAFSGAALLALFLFYWLYGGLFAFALVCFGLSGDTIGKY